VETTEQTTATELATLPGLETIPGSVTPEIDHKEAPEHWIERGPQKRLMLFSGRSHPELATKIGERLGVELGEVTIGSFANGETYCRFEESIRGADVFLVQTGCEPVDRNLMELLIMIQAAKLASAKRITAVVPWYPYARQDRKARPREPITARLVADMLQVAGVDRVLTMDLHAGQIQGFFSIPVDHMVALPIFAQHLRDQGLSGTGVVSVAPDAGRAKMAVKFAELLGADFAIMHKTRPAHDEAAVTEVTGNVRDKVAIVGDDVIMTGGTLLAGARALREAGATKVYVCATHGIFAKDSLERFRDAKEIDGLIVTDTIPIDPILKPDNVTVLTVSGLLAETIMNVFADESVSAIFQGENQLF
jgi:ribose-phosphate pyrophosphokinase